MSITTEHVKTSECLWFPYYFQEVDGFVDLEKSVKKTVCVEAYPGIQGVSQYGTRVDQTAHKMDLQIV